MFGIAGYPVSQGTQRRYLQGWAQQRRHQRPWINQAPDRLIRWTGRTECPMAGGGGGLIKSGLGGTKSLSS